MSNLSNFTGPMAFGRAYQRMLENDGHAKGSVDRILLQKMIRLCPETADHLYDSFTPLELRDEGGSRPELEGILNRICPATGSKGDAVDLIVKFTAGLAPNVAPELKAMLIGGTEEQIIRRGSDWCPDVARVACVLCQLAGFPARIVWLFDLEAAYSGHVIIESFRAGNWGALDPSTGVAYRHRDGRPASTWELMNDPALVERHARDPKAFYTSVGQFRCAGLANYFSWEADQYVYSTTHLNEYCFSILTMSDKGWPGGLRWLHGEDGRQAEQGAPADADRPRP